MLLALTGATGFIGQHLLWELPKRGYRLRVLLRRPTVVPTWTVKTFQELAGLYTQPPSTTKF
jgi:uncharacterized protein YbjT (DUF2867 family)